MKRKLPHDRGVAPSRPGLIRFRLRQYNRRHQSYEGLSVIELVRGGFTPVEEDHGTRILH
jgi:hypothetical protein